MQKLWNKFGDNFFSKIQIGTLEVIYANKEKKLYGEKKENEKIIIRAACKFHHHKLVNL